MKFSTKNIDYTFLVFLLLITQGNLPLKIIGVIYIVIFRSSAFKNLHTFGLFYFFIIVYHLLYGTILIFFESFKYFPIYIMVLSFWMISYISLSQIIYFIKRNSLDKTLSTIDSFFLINVVLVLFQFIGIIYSYSSINPYGVSTSAGDFIKSIYSNSSVNAIIMCFFSVMYLLRKKWKQGIIAVVILMMTTYMSGIVIFAISILISLFLFSKLKLKYKSLIILSGIGFLIVFKEISPNNVTYVTRYINRIIENGDDVPFKIKSFKETIDYSTSSLKNFIFGAGAGNFSSRIAFISSGDYVDWYPNTLIYSSNDFEKNHLALWNYDFNNPWDNRNNTANQPFSIYNQIIGEYGLIGVLLFSIFYIGFVVRNWKKLTYAKFILISLVFYFVLDYWFEYFSVMVIFELLLMLDIKLNTKIETEKTVKNAITV